MVRALLKAGFYIHHQTGSHARLLHRIRTELRVTVPIHAKDVPPSLLKRILRQAALSEEEFWSFL
ncbi:MAG TPA: type II toxin-antitoxin system HicA family toxin [Terriglobia bacterium]|nr:type II toxin-antitoxin system HicA family toxin [Terriglobia bacterium]